MTRSGASNDALRSDDKPDGVVNESVNSPASHAERPSEHFDLESLLKAGIGSRVDRDGSSSGPQDWLDHLLSHPRLRDLAKSDPAKFSRVLSVVIARIDGLVNRQLNAILHHPVFQKLESSWRGLKYLHTGMEREERDDIKLKILNASWGELEADFRKQSEFDQSFLFKAVYENEYGQAGGHPFGVLVGDFEVRPKLAVDHPHDDLFVLSSIAQVAAASFCPFIAAASPKMFDFDDFSRLERTVDLEKYFQDPSFFQWQKLREEEDSRFIGLTLPRILMRLPYQDDVYRTDTFRFREEVERGTDLSNYLWGNAAYAFASVLLRSFSDTEWFIDTRGVEPGVEGGGLVPRLPVASFETDAPGIALKPSTDVVVSEHLDRSLSELGFIPLCHCHDTEYCAFFSNRSIQKPAEYGSAEANASARMSSMLQYMFCVSRFAHFLKVMARDLIGSMETDSLQKHLNNWLAEYMCGADSSARAKMERPLENGRVMLVKEPGKAGAYQCRITLKPHFELEELVASVTFNTRLTGTQPV
jgi:type VI secretion system ImpC/EvpB family protein